MSPRVAVIVPLPVHPDRALAMLHAVAGLAELPEHDVVLVDTSAGALDALLERAVGDVAVLRPAAAGGPAAALVTAAAATDAEVLAVMSPDARPGALWLSALVDVLDDPAVAVATSVAADGTPGVHGLAARRADVPRASRAHTLAELALELAARGAVRPAPNSIVALEEGPVGGRAFGAEPELSIVIPTLSAATDRVQRTLRAVEATVDVPHEVVLVHNGAAPQGFSAPVNSGLRAARGRYVVVMNDDVEPLAHWWPPLRGVLDAGAAVVFPCTVDSFDRSDFAAWCFGMTRATLDAYAVAPGEFLDPELVVHWQDTDLLLRLTAAGRPPVRVLDSRIRHALSLTVGSPDPELRAWVGEQVVRDEEAFAERHADALAAMERIHPRDHVAVDA